MMRRFVSWAGFVPEGNAHDLAFRTVLGYLGRFCLPRSPWARTHERRVRD